MAWVDYDAYMRSPEWADVREVILTRAGEHCEWCDRYCGPDLDKQGDDYETLEVHHMTYERFGRELPGDLRAICWGCHDQVTPHQRAWKGLSADEKFELMLEWERVLSVCGKLRKLRRLNERLADEEAA